MTKQSYMNMIERVANSINCVLIFETGEHCTRDLLEKLAKAAIEAMKEPTDQMLMAGRVSSHLGQPMCYKAMIKAALEIPDPEKN